MSTANFPKSSNQSETRATSVATVLRAGQRTVFKLNGREVSTTTSTERLSDFLRSSERCLDVKVGCNAGDCGACSVLVDGKLICSCLTALSQVGGKTVETVSGLSETDHLMRQLQQSFLMSGAAQCGICTPGMLVSAVALLREHPAPTEEQVQDALCGVLCRCTGYRKIISAVMNAVNVGEDWLHNKPSVVSESPDDLEDRDQDGPAASIATTGQSIVRLDGDVKVLGTDRFGDDTDEVFARELRVIRSPYHRARFSFDNLQSIVDKYDSVLDGILTARDIPGENCFGVIPPFIDQPVFAESEVRFKGEAIAAIVGDSLWLERIVEDLRINWTELPAVLDPLAAQQPDADCIHDSMLNNVLCRGHVRRGDAQSMMDKSAFRVSGTFTTGFVEHAYIEPEAGYARRVDDTLEIYGCTQAPYMDRESIARIMGMEQTSIRIIPSSVGGGFGSKLDLSFQPFVALAAWRFGRVVRMVYSRQESMQSTTKRHPSRMQVEIGTDREGRVAAMLFDGTFNTGAYASWGPTVANRVPVHASGPYHTPSYTAQTKGVYTNCAPAGAFRGFGVPQAAIAQESLYDELAKRLGLDRLEFRRLNALENGQATVTGQTFSSGVGIRPCLDALKQHWAEACTECAQYNEASSQNGSPLRRGVGIASGWYGCGNTSLPNPSTIKAGIKADGGVYLHQGAVDIGQGSTTVITQIFAQTLGVPVESIQLLSADSAITPDAGKTSASRQTFVSGNAALRTANALRDQISRLTNCFEIQTIDASDGWLTVNRGCTDTASLQLSALTPDEAGYVFVAEESYDPPTTPMNSDGQGEPYALFGYAAQMVVLDVDTILGTVSLVRIAAAHDVGKAINPMLVEGQIQGGVAQGIGMALMEEFLPGHTDNLHDYLIPTIGDVPPIDTIIVEEKDLHGPMGAKGLGEHVLIPTAPAILNAIADATGARIYDIPATPDRILSALQQKGGDS
ncbi:MAG: molybdopterin-dependent oxidoreductase [Granulosicoccus sp.]